MTEEVSFSRLMNEWNNKYKKALNSSVIINSAGDAALYEKATSTLYLRARNYNPSTGRFISRDSFAGRRSDPLSLNLYTYCRNNPNVYVDPSGHSYGELPDGTKMSINSASDANKFNLKRDKQLVELSSKRLSTGRYNVANIVAAYKREQTRELIMAQINYNFDMTSKQSLDVNSSKNTTLNSGNNSFFGAEYSIVYNQSKEIILGSYGIIELKSSETNSYLIQKNGDSSCPISVFCQTSYNNLDLASNNCGIKINYYNQCTTLYLGPNKIGIGLSYNNGCKMLNVIEPTHEMMLGLSLSESSIFCNVSTTYKISDVQSFSQSVEASVDYRYLALLYGLSSSGQYYSSEPITNTSYNLAPIG